MSDVVEIKGKNPGSPREKRTDVAAGKRTDIIKPPPLPPRAAPIQNFLEAIERDELLLALEQSTQAPMIAVAKALADPTADIFGVVKKNGATLLDLVTCFKEYKQAEGIIRMMRHVPDVMEDVAIDAKSSQVVCPRCDGAGQSEGVRCPVCKGQGEVRVKGDDAARSLLFEAQGLKGKKGPQVAIQQNFTGGPGLEETLSFTQKMLVE